MSHFERQIFKLDRLAKAGSHALALVGSLSLIEGLLRLFVPRRRGKGKNLAGLVSLIDRDGESHQVRSDIDQLRGIRNDFVHMEAYAKASGMLPYEIVDLDLDSLVQPEDAEMAIHCAWYIYRMANSGMLNKA
ncbi:MAG: hypothetical protein RLO08_09655 [Parvibaculaceae bacterium]